MIARNQAEMPRWAMAVIVVGVLAVLALGYMGFRALQKPADLSPSELQKTQAAERPGDPKSGGQPQAQPNQSAD